MNIPQLSAAPEPGVDRREALAAHVHLLFRLVHEANTEAEKQEIRAEIDKHLGELKTL